MNESQSFPNSGRSRVVIENVAPQIDGGRFAIKRTVGESVVVEADIFADGHDSLCAVLKFRAAKNSEWTEIPMEFLTNDRWRGEFVAAEIGDYFYTVEAWVDHFKSWRLDLKKKLDAGQNISVDLQTGAKFIEAAARRASAPDSEKFLKLAKELNVGETANGSRLSARALENSVADLMSRYPDRGHATIFEKELRVSVDPERARFSAWYELFPRSFGGFKNCAAQLPRIAKMGFDVLYFPPIHPIGKSFRKGKNNNPACKPGEPGSPWAIGSSEGGHKSIHPELGTLDDFKNLVSRARELKIEIALDMTFQCSPDHPYVKEHPGWFLKRPDGSIQYAENPPKKYEDIYPFNFECDDWRGLWRELKGVFEFWIGQGITIFRVDNPHTKPFAFWEWCICELKRENPKLIFLAEAFTRPKVMYCLAKLGFTQSYNYFPWRNRKNELTGYFTELTQTPVAEFFRPNLWPNTPDILTGYLQTGGRAAFMVRLILAATLGASYGIYGPAFELCENKPRETGGEEYLNSEKYEIRRWNLAAPENLENLVARINQIRRENPALQTNERLKFVSVANESLLAYTKSTADGADVILTVVNLDPHRTQIGWLDFPFEQFNLRPDQTYQMHDLLTDARYSWRGSRNYIELNPANLPAHIFRLRQLS